MSENQRKVSLKEKLSYKFDNIMAKGPIALVGLLFMITLIVVIIAGLFVVIIDRQYDSVTEGIWVSLMHAIDAGTLAGDSGSLFFIFMMTIVTICGLFITSILIGIINNGMEAKMEALRKGKSNVIESNHIVILGFNDNIFTLVPELIEANANQKSAAIVIMDPKLEKEEMEDQIRQRIDDFKTTKIICRSGSISDFNDLAVCSPEYSKSIIINSDDDFETIKSILAVTSILKNKHNTTTYITAVIHKHTNYDAAMIAGEGRAEILFFEDTIARIVAHTSRLIGYSNIYTELFNYDGDEIYIEDIPCVNGLKMQDLNLYFNNSTILGIKRDKEIMLNPDINEVVMPNDKLILIAEDDGVTKRNEQIGVVNKSLVSNNPVNSCEVPQKILILRYGPRLGKILDEYDTYMAKGSEIHLACRPKHTDYLNNMIRDHYENIKVTVIYEDIYSKHKLNELLDWNPEAILVSSGYQDDAEVDDSRTLLLLLQLRALALEKHQNFTITSEMREVKNQELASITQVKNFVISSNITSLMVTKIAEIRELNEIFDELLTEKGSEIYMRPASDYVELNKEMNLYTAAYAASLKNQVFLGYRHYDASNDNYVVYTNPTKDTVLSFSVDDRFIVLARD